MTGGARGRGGGGLVGLFSWRWHADCSGDARLGRGGGRSESDGVGLILYSIHSLSSHKIHMKKAESGKGCELFLTKTRHAGYNR